MKYYAIAVVDGEMPEPTSPRLMTVVPVVGTATDPELLLKKVLKDVWPRRYKDRIRYVSIHQLSGSDPVITVVPCAGKGFRVMAVRNDQVQIYRLEGDDGSENWVPDGEVMLSAVTVVADDTGVVAQDEDKETSEEDAVIFDHTLTKGEEVELPTPISENEVQEPMKENVPEVQAAPEETPKTSGASEENFQV